MPFIKVVKRPCKCKLPTIDLDEFYFGTIWRCTECDQEYKLKSDQREGPIWIKHFNSLKSGGWQDPH